MLPILILIALLIGLSVISYILSDSDSGFVVSISVSSGILALITFMFLIAIPIKRFEYKKDYVSYLAFSQTIDDARKSNLNYIERAAMLKDISEWNQKIERAKYMNQIFLIELLVPDDFCDLPKLQ